MVFLEIQNVTLWPVFSNPVTFVKKSVSIDAKRYVYIATVLSTLLCWAEAWEVKLRLFRLDEFRIFSIAVSGVFLVGLSLRCQLNFKNNRWQFTENNSRTFTNIIQE